MVINPTLACADPLNLAGDVRLLESMGIHRFHIDIMDGHYVPNLCMNLDQVQALSEMSSAELDVHLMVTDPYPYLRRLSGMKVNMVSFHPGTIREPMLFMGEAKSSGLRVGVCINPNETVEIPDGWLEMVDFIQLMAVKPGFAGQQFIIDTYERISYFSNLRKRRGYTYEIQVDGGINILNGQKCASLGVDCLVVGALCLFLNEVPLSYSAEQVIRAFSAKRDIHEL